MFDEPKYRAFFRSVTGAQAFDYQARVAQLLTEHKNVLLRAPTGAGKTWSAIVPFLSDGWQHRPNRLIYALPLRTLAQGVFAQAKLAASKLGLPIEPVFHASGREISSPYVTLQTGEQPDDPFFSRGRIIVTTYDQVLSGLLESPYGLSRGLHNINAAAVAGALVVFDEFHLMPADKAFLTAVAGMHLFRDLCQSVWMTATATSALQNVLRDALATQPVPGDPAQWDTLLKSLATVTAVRRDIVMEGEPLTSQVVLDHHQSRSIVMFNQVRRAQEFYRELRKEIEARQLRVEIILLHSRFFKGDRLSKEERLRKLFGKASEANAILISTQVIEAGVDISCEHLHTEVCPVNSLVQRAGRCARFEGEEGIVHVYGLPKQERAWLPYGDQKEPDRTLSATEALLENVGRSTLNPTVVDEWVEKVHQATDERSLRQGWASRLKEILVCIENTAVHRAGSGVAHLIRGVDQDQVRVVISREGNLPSTPGKREGLNVSRKSLFGLLRERVQPAGWYWDVSDHEAPWKPLGTPADITGTYVVCLKPETAAYDCSVGLRLKEGGDEESPLREEPQRPGVPALRREHWVDHAARVAQETERRLNVDDLISGGLSAWGFEHRYGLRAHMVRSAARACALLHDLGKLQTGWQDWAEAYQRKKVPGYQHVTPLAHTDFDSNNEEDWLLQRNLGIRRPPHSAASAYYGVLVVAKLLGVDFPLGVRDQISSACAAAILAHHGGWLPPAATSGQSVGVLPLCAQSNEAISQLLGKSTELKMITKLESKGNKRAFVEKWLEPSTHADNLCQWWPMVSFLTRTLRLSDRRATSEGATDE
jgi:CRISPR-associated endonuclease/helicase Cas3